MAYKVTGKSEAQEAVVAMGEEGKKKLFYSIPELRSYTKRSRLEAVARGTWGQWTYEDGTLAYQNKYWINLGELDSSKDILLTIAHMVEKTWVREGTNLVDLITALEDILNWDFSNAIRVDTRPPMYIAPVVKKKETLWTILCPFCGKKHQHSAGEGYRVPHCLKTPHRDNYYVREMEAA